METKLVFAAAADHAASAVPNGGWMDGRTAQIDCFELKIPVLKFIRAVVRIIIFNLSVRVSSNKGSDVFGTLLVIEDLYYFYVRFFLNLIIPFVVFFILCHVKT